MGKNFKLDKFITIPKNLIVPPSTVLPVTNENRNFWLIIILIVISAFFVLGVALMIFKRILNDRMFISNILSNPANVIIDKGTNLRAPLQANSIPIDVLPRKREVTIVYTREVPKILETNIALVNFLRVACNLVEIRFDLDDEVAVRENPLGWYTREDQQFIYIETEGAVLRENNFLNNRKTYHIEEDALDDAFLYSFNHTIDNPSSRTNSSKYIVVHFTFTPEDVRFDTYANCKRYIISSNRTDEFCHLAQLCHFINYNEDLTPSTANLKQFYDKWKDTTKFKALRCAIHEATCYVKENPNYVREIFRVTSESFSENEVHEGFRGCSKSSSESENDKLLC